jgi:hypothetical protein
LADIAEDLADEVSLIGGLNLAAAEADVAAAPDPDGWAASSVEMVSETTGEWRTGVGRTSGPIHRVLQQFDAAEGALRVAKNALDDIDEMGISSLARLGAVMWDASIGGWVMRGITGETTNQMLDTRLREEKESLAAAALAQLRLALNEAAGQVMGETAEIAAPVVVVNPDAPRTGDVMPPGPGGGGGSVPGPGIGIGGGSVPPPAVSVPDPPTSERPPIRITDPVPDPGRKVPVLPLPGPPGDGTDPPGVPAPDDPGRPAGPGRDSGWETTDPDGRVRSDGSVAVGGGSSVGVGTAGLGGAGAWAAGAAGLARGAGGAAWGAGGSAGGAGAGGVYGSQSGLPAGAAGGRLGGQVGIGGPGGGLGGQAGQAGTAGGAGASGQGTTAMGGMGRGGGGSSDSKRRRAKHYVAPRLESPPEPLGLAPGAGRAGSREQWAREAAEMEAAGLFDIDEEDEYRL